MLGFGWHIWRYPLPSVVLRFFADGDVVTRESAADPKYFVSPRAHTQGGRLWIVATGSNDIRAFPENIIKCVLVP